MRSFVVSGAVKFFWGIVFITASLFSFPIIVIAHLPGDANNDGKVSGMDYVIWFNHYDRPVSSPSPVPSPSPPAESRCLDLKDGGVLFRDNVMNEMDLNREYELTPEYLSTGTPASIYWFLQSDEYLKLANASREYKTDFLQGPDDKIYLEGYQLTGDSVAKLTAKVNLESGNFCKEVIEFEIDN